MDPSVPVPLPPSVSLPLCPSIEAVLSSTACSFPYCALSNSTSSLSPFLPLSLELSPTPCSFRQHSILVPVPPSPLSL
ncbi:hypothetical protein RJT34_20582 [Clitoria ternatea]|uniref:Uncharacterized protein n=1 Tax=Clitoria ternatea TaxID=43366 RepID=A0AAN9P5X4_CLITE